MRVNHYLKRGERGIRLRDKDSVRLAHMIGMSHAFAIILTGRSVSGEEALRNERQNDIKKLKKIKRTRLPK